MNRSLLLIGSPEFGTGVSLCFQDIRGHRLEPSSWRVVNQAPEHLTERRLLAVRRLNDALRTSFIAFVPTSSTRSSGRQFWTDRPSRRLRLIDVPTLVLWGEADQIADSDYGRVYADAIPGARFALLECTGDVPQIETPETLLDAIREFVA